MESSAAKPAKAKPVIPPALSPGQQGTAQTLGADLATPDIKAVGYGLPCANCRAYYPADIASCPV